MEKFIAYIAGTIGLVAVVLGTGYLVVPEHMPFEVGVLHLPFIDAEQPGVSLVLFGLLAAVISSLLFVMIDIREWMRIRG